ncbi:single-stranded-DNA-specific exonuclease RecJ [Chlamydia trachomatis]|uniref:Single-stranded-DNA-specific exonuclease RecJ n=4 Tax=Chlamydia trachomatis TaxID=813 RepID=O84453_CHLTR|nr:single-stranded-DNA-specific exonuclease RecJ [Chlamydia trachomatis]NP_219960.1 single-stranded-DNA-specific exonuclease [Chlamydia trachomatis D/UW-3/CX]AAC68046.1 ssDNA Exonuclease [Chlamydia trachomatis D/UW-3/CX]AAX50720.1 RecJ [Chlamydia trachomatis A/HAR-13]ADH18147.1 single-stranded-DNA-specific exonuclease [Chlamydia trachomatis G/9768]ADH19070.1 single-stranded-DNA-specific exonuclease [Chlamydia trachomatis G/11222]ADH19995.1 single-stranded-DNA-specific exonuclease [Chlamydia t
MEKDSLSSLGQKWDYPKHNEVFLKKILKEFHLHPAIAQVLISRGFQSIQEIRDFLYPQLSSLHSTSLFLDMEKAVARLLQAKANNEHVMIYGDGDVDGITGVTLIVEFLQILGVKTSYCCSGTLFKQHGETASLISQMLQDGISLLITVDCGITAGKEVHAINKQGIDVIVTDHHMPTGKLPHCVAMLNPKLDKNPYPNKELTGVGVAFKLVCATYEELIQQDASWKDKIDLLRFLDLVSLGTIADVGRLSGENRILVSYGIKEIAKGKRLGLKKLCSLSGVDKSEVSSTNLGIRITPKLNSLGRLADSSQGVKLLLSHDPKNIGTIVSELSAVNQERQRIEAEVLRDVERILAANPKLTAQSAIVLASPNWHSRVIPIISARLARTYNKPVAIIALQDGIGKGSLRTIGSFPLLGVLRKCESFFLSYGGHDFAAGLMIKEDQVEGFRKKFIHLVSSSLRKDDAMRTLSLDVGMDFSRINRDLIASMELLEPFGKGNVSPVFYTKAIQVRYPKLLAGNHVKLYLNSGERNLEGTAFGQGDKISLLKANWNIPLDIAYTLRIMRRSARGAIRLLIQDFRIQIPRL